MKKLFSFSALIMFGALTYCQVIRGTVYDSETLSPIPYAAVYFTGTLVGTTSNENGEFELDVTKYDTEVLRIRAIGYLTFILDSFLEDKQNKIFLIPDLFEIGEVSVETKNLERRRKANLKIFKREFLGTSGNQKQCEIINEEDITFNYGFDKDTMKAYARKPIKIFNGALGYDITYHLDKFEYDKNRNVVSYTGDIVFNEDLAVGQSTDNSYTSRRKRTYLGSSMHFFRALWDNNLIMHGFTVVKYSFDLVDIRYEDADITYEDIVVAEDENRKYLLATEKRLTINYKFVNKSTILFLKPRVLFGRNGFFDPTGIIWYGHMASQRIGDMLPYDYIIGSSQLSSLDSSVPIKGTVSDAEQQPLPNVHVINQRSNKATQTGANGGYFISASPGDTLLFTFVGMEPVEIQVEESPSVIDVSMQELIVKLEEVEVKARYVNSHKTQKELLAEFPENKSLVKTSIGIIDRDLSSTSFRIVDGNDMVPGGRDFLSSLVGYVPQMKVIRDDSGDTKVYLRNYGGSPGTAIFDVDGFISISPPTYLNAGDIDRIAILERNAAIMRYGTQGAAGVIVINTRARTEMDDMGVIRSYDNRALADSLNKAVTYLEPYHPIIASYVEELNEADTRKKAHDIFENQKKSYLNDPYYFVEVYDFFLTKWGNDKISKEIFQDAKNRWPDNGPVLKALAYIQQQYGNFESALDLYIQILLMQSWEAQPLRDVANAYAETGNLEGAWMYYTQFIDIQNQLPDAHFDAYGEDMLITTEMMGILDRTTEPFFENRDTVSTLDDDMRTRLVFEWNNKEAEFELQFVTPEGYYDTWEHISGNALSQDPEIAKGYCSKQFILGKENIGLWQVNIDYKGNNSELPTYFKVSIYRNFGLDDQHLEVKVYKLSERQGMVQLLTLEQS